MTVFDTSGITRGADGIAYYDDLPATLVELLRLPVEEAPDREALVEVGGERLTYRQVWDRAARVAGGLAARGIGRGDRVAILLPNGLDWALAFWGTQFLGAIAVPVNTRLAQPEVEYVLDDSGATYVFRPGEPLPTGTPTVDENAAPDDVAAIFYTSGTTGFPKGAMTTHRNFATNTENAIRCNRMRGSEPARGLISVPLFHVTGCNSQLLATVALHGTSVIMPSFDVGVFLDTIRDERTDVLVSVPAIYWLAINQPSFAGLDVSHVRVLAYGGAPAAPDLVRSLMRAFPHSQLFNGFGLTETSSIATVLPHEHAAERPETVGFAAPVVDVRVDPLGDDPHEGELLIRGPNVVKGYWNKPDKTAQTFENGWLRSGDIARIDDEGFVEIVDRAKDMINRGGENVYSVEVENALTAHPAVGEVAVVGVPDEMMGEKVGAVVVPLPGARVEASELLAFARERLAGFKVPQYMVLSEEPLPRNPGGKLVKPRLRENTDWGQPLR